MFGEQKNVYKMNESGFIWEPWLPRTWKLAWNALFSKLGCYHLLYEVVDYWTSDVILNTTINLSLGLFKNVSNVFECDIEWKY